MYEIWATSDNIVRRIWANIIRVCIFSRERGKTRSWDMVQGRLRRDDNVVSERSLVCIIDFMCNRKLNARTSTYGNHGTVLIKKRERNYLGVGRTIINKKHVYLV